METMIDKDDVEIRKHLKKFVRERLEELEMSDSDLARATGDSPAQIHRVVTGKATPSSAFARRIARAIHCSLDELLNNSVHAHA
jgi:transcriptional regulator with XRE-family HTH domain